MPNHALRTAIAAYRTASNTSPHLVSAAPLASRYNASAAVQSGGKQQDKVQIEMTSEQGGKKEQKQPFEKEDKGEEYNCEGKQEESKIEIQMRVVAKVEDAAQMDLPSQASKEAIEEQDQKQPQRPWCTVGSAYLQRGVSRYCPDLSDRSEVKVSGIITGWLSALKSDFEDYKGQPAPLWHMDFDDQYQAEMGSKGILIMKSIGSKSDVSSENRPVKPKKSPIKHAMSNQ